MKVTVSFEAEDFAHAREIIAAVETLYKVPYRMEGFGPPIVRNGFEGQTGSTAENGGEKVLSDVQGTQAAPRPNVSPGEPSIGKIGGSTKDYLLNELKAGSRAVEYKDFHKFKEHLKLLWKRGEIKFDDTTKEYYL